jgi:EpsI family protein
VVYWVRIGDTVSRNPWQTRWYILREGVAGRIPDGILVRTSQVVRSADRKEASVALQQRFLADLLAALPPAQRALLAPTDPPRLAAAR